MKQLKVWYLGAVVVEWHRPSASTFTSLSAADCDSATSHQLAQPPPLSRRPPPPPSSSCRKAMKWKLSEKQQRRLFDIDLFKKLKRKEKKSSDIDQPAAGSTSSMVRRPRLHLAPPPLPSLTPPPPPPPNTHTAPHQHHSNSAPMSTVTHLHSQS